MKPLKIKFLIIGAHGLVGSTIISSIKNKWDYEATGFRHHENSMACDITDKASVDQVFKKVKPTHVVHCANLKGGVVYCQSHPKEAKAFHYTATQYIGEACQKYHAKLLYISTECVFDGEKKTPYLETDARRPINKYGQYKAESERWIERSLKNYIIVRTMSVFGWQTQTVSPNAVMSMYFSLQEKKPIHVSSYRWGTPTYVKDLAKTIVELSLSSAKGIYHVTGSTYLNRYQWLKKTCAYLGWDQSYIMRQDKEKRGPAIYPGKIRLSTKKFNRQFKTKLHSLSSALQFLKQDIRKDK